MKNSIAVRIGVFLLTGLLIYGVGMTAKAGEVPPGHVCAYSLMANNVVVSHTTESFHYYTYTNPQSGEQQTLVCEVYSETRGDLMQCACGRRVYSNLNSRYNVHSSCGL